MGTNTNQNEIDKASAVEASWFVSSPPPPARGWLVYTLDFALATLQGCVTEPEHVRRTTGWLILATAVRCGMGVSQAIIMFLAYIPIISSCLETVARVYSRNAVGFFLRACYWKAKLKHLGQDTIIDQYVDIWGASSISIGSHCHIDTYVRLAAGERRHGQHGSIAIGDYVHLGPGVHISGRGHVEIHDLVGISANVHIYSATNVVEYPPDPGQLISMSHIAPHGHQHIYESPVVIEEYAFLGMMTRVMPGVRVGRAAVVHANSELRKDVPPFANIGGMPQGRQIGWRQPRRPSVRLSRAQVVVVCDGFTIREVVDEHETRTLEEVLALHNEAFREGVTTQLGRVFLLNYYRAMIRSSDCSLWVAEQDGHVVGFQGATINRHAFERMNRSGMIRLLAAWRFCTFRLSPFAILRAIRKHRLSGGYADHAELLSIVVSPTVRRIGLGKRFLLVLMEHLLAREQSSFIVFTDNPEGIGFYEKYGGRCLFKFELASLSSACFRFKVPPESPRLITEQGPDKASPASSPAGARDLAGQHKAR